MSNSKNLKSLTPAVLKRMIAEEKHKLMMENSAAESFLKQGKNKTNPYTAKSSKAGMHEVSAEDYAETINLINKAKMLKEEEQKLKKKLMQIQEMTKRVKARLLRDL